MTKFYGKVGYGMNTEIRPGVYDDTIVEYNYYGDVIRDTRTTRTGDKVNNDLTIGNSFKIVADAFAYEHFYAMRYIEWMGSLWTISEVEVQAPRLVIRVGGVYNGPTP